MIRQYRNGILLAIFVTLMVSASNVYSRTSDLQGKAAPNFTLKSEAGVNMKLSEYRGQVVMLNFWATWCGPCRQEMPHLNELSSKYERLGFTLMGINIDEDPQRANNMVDKLLVGYPVLYDQSKAISKLYQVDAMPTTLLIDRDGRVRYVHRGYKKEYLPLYDEQIRALLKE